MLWYAPGLDQDCPLWVYVSWAIGLFLYQTFDAVDGTQARRTGQSGPLGELFDHGVDAMNTTLEVLIFAACMKLGQGWKTVMTLFASLLTFYVQTWEEYHTKTLTLGLISGPVEGILTLCLVYALTAYVGGGSFWEQSLFQSIGVKKQILPSLLNDLSWNEWYMVYGGIVLVFNTTQSILNVMAARRSRNLDPTHALRGLVPFSIAWTLIPIYLYLNPLILSQHLVPFCFYAGLMNAYSVGQIIVTHLTQARFPYYNVLHLPLLIGVIDSAGPWLQRHFGAGWPSALGSDVYQVAFVFMCVGTAAGVYGSFVVDVIVGICDYLDIWCLTIKHPRTEGTEETKKTI